MLVIGSLVVADDSASSPVPIDRDVFGTSHSQFTHQEGKTVVNYGDKPVTVVVTAFDGREEEITVPPGTGMALPPDTAKVERDLISHAGVEARDQRVTVSGDDMDMELPGSGNTSGVALDPNRPTVARPVSDPIDRDVFGTSHSQFTHQEGKTVVNYGDKPVTVVVTAFDGSEEEITVPPGTGMALPPGTAKVERDLISRAGVDTRDQRVTVSGDDMDMELAGSGNTSGVALDPNRPTVVRPVSEPIDRDVFGTSHSQFTHQEGKTIVNYGDKPVTVVVTTVDGREEEITVPPGTGMALPPGTAKVERDLISHAGVEARDQRVTVSGDDMDMELAGSGNTSGVALDPNRPTVVRPVSEPIDRDVFGTSHSQFTHQEGKTIVNYGDKPVTVVVTTVDGREEEITVPPGTGMALPPGTTKVERDLVSRAGVDTRDQRITVTGDGQELDLPGTGDIEGIILDPRTPGLMSARKSIRTDEATELSRVPPMDDRDRSDPETVHPVPVENSILILIDASGSMRGGKIASAIATANRQIQGLGPETEVAVRAFSGNAVRFPFAQMTPEGRAKAQAAISSITASGPTPLAAAIRDAGSYIRSSARGRNLSLIILSDGEETAGGNPPEEVRRLNDMSVRW